MWQLIHILAWFGYFIFSRKEIRFLQFGKELISCLSHANVRAFMKILTVYTLNSHLSTLKESIPKKLYALVVCWNIWSLFDKQCRSRSDCSCRSSLTWVHTVCLYTYVNQYTGIFRWSYFAGVLGVNHNCLYWDVMAQDDTVSSE